MLRFAVLAAALATSGPLQNAPQAPPAPTYDARFTGADGQVYSGTLTFAVDAKGAVSGKMRLTDPLEILATLAGTVKDGKWSFEFPYEIPEQGCTGVVKGTATVPADGKVIQGTGVAGGGCTEQPIDLTFAFTRK